ncbi:MAG: hypothetical protein HFI47_10485 [Lachnospiraceae bacterium]|jgi:hypothetical protein|nr:hypothetical protein [Lachnospiraceae bacterium]
MMDGPERETCVRITDIDSVSQMNPGQYLSKDDTGLTLSLSAKQAAPLAKGMCGILVHNGSVFVVFVAE